MTTKLFWFNIVALISLFVVVVIVVLTGGCGDPDEPAAGWRGSSIPAAPVIGAPGGWNHPDAGPTEGGAP